MGLEGVEFLGLKIKHHFRSVHILERNVYERKVITWIVYLCRYLSTWNIRKCHPFKRDTTRVIPEATVVKYGVLTVKICF